MKFSNAPWFVGRWLVDVETCLESDIVQSVDVFRIGHPPAHPNPFLVPISQGALTLQAKKDLQLVVLHTPKISDGGNSRSCWWQQARVVPPKAGSPSQGAEPCDTFFDTTDVKNWSQAVDLRKRRGCHRESLSRSEGKGRWPRDERSWCWGDEDFFRPVYHVSGLVWMSIIPRWRASKPRTRCPIPCPRVRKICPAERCRWRSAARALKVVKPPSRPMRTAGSTPDHHSGARCMHPRNRPVKKHPSRLTSRVGQRN